MTDLCKNIYYCPCGFRFCFVSFAIISHFLTCVAHYKTLTLCLCIDSLFAYSGIILHLPGLWKVLVWILATTKGHITIFKMPAILFVNAHRTSNSYHFHSVSKMSNVSLRIYAHDAIIPRCPNPLRAQNCVSFFLCSIDPNPPTANNPHHCCSSDILNSVLSLKNRDHLHS